MNKYQKRKSREIKALMRRGKFGETNYKKAKKSWQWVKRFQWCTPCEDCDNPFCFKQKNAIAYCPDRR